MAIQSLKWYLQERRDKQDMKQIASTQRASTLMRAIFYLFKSLRQKRKNLENATIAFEFRKVQRHGMIAIQSMRRNVRSRRQARMFAEKAAIFRSFKTHEKVFRGLFSYCVKKAASNIAK